MNRSNEEWLDALGSHGPDREAALADLREILLQGLYRGLLGKVNTSAPGFESMAEDFVQEALLKFLANLDSFAGRSRFTTWAHKITVSVALTELRRKRWQDRSLEGIIDVGDGDYTPSFTADTSPTPENATERADMLSRVERIILEELTERQRTALVNSIIYGHSTSRVAHELGMKQNAVYKLLHDARLKLKRRLAEEGLTTSEVIDVFA